MAKKKPTTAPAKLKRGRLSLEDRELITQRLSEGLSVEAVASEMGRTPESIYDYAVTNESTTENSLRAKLLTQLKSESFWKPTTEQLSRQETSYFIDTYCDLINQLGEETTPSEKLQLKQYVIYEIMGNRSMKRATSIDVSKAAFERELVDEKASGDPDWGVMQNLGDRIKTMDKDAVAATNEFLAINKKAEDTLKSLKATRDLRVQNKGNDATSWGALIKMLNDDETRKKVGREIELHRYSKEKVLQELSQLHKFGDDIPDAPILTSELYNG